MKRKFSSAFKAQVAIEALKERETLSDLSKRFEVHPIIISKWKQEFLVNSAAVFDKSAHKEESDTDTEKLFAKIGQLEMGIRMSKYMFFAEKGLFSFEAKR